MFCSLKLVLVENDKFSVPSCVMDFSVFSCSSVLNTNWLQKKKTYCDMLLIEHSHSYMADANIGETFQV